MNAMRQMCRCHRPSKVQKYKDDRTTAVTLSPIVHEALSGYQVQGAAAFGLDLGCVNTAYDAIERMRGCTDRATATKLSNASIITWDRIGKPMLKSARVLKLCKADTPVGLAVAEILLRRGSKVVLTGRASKNIDVIVRTYGSENVLAIPLESRDLATSSGRVVDAAIETFGSVDKLICCARLMTKYRTETVTVDCVKRTWNEQVLGPFHLIQASLQHLKKSTGSVVLLSSFESSKPDGFLQSLAAVSKVTLAKLAAQELRESNIRFNTVSPYGSYLEIEMPPQTWTDLIYSKLFVPPLGRKVRSDEVAELLVFAVSDALLSISGNDLAIDSGISVTSPPSYSSLLTLAARVSHVVIEFQNSVLRFFKRK